MSNSNKQYLNFKKEEIEKAGGYIKVDDNGQLDIFIPRSLLNDKFSKKEDPEPEKQEEFLVSDQTTVGIKEFSKIKYKINTKEFKISNTKK